MTRPFVWATVTGTSPLRVKLDGDTAALPITPDTLIDPAQLAVNDRVRCEFTGSRFVVVGRSGGVSLYTRTQLDGGQLDTRYNTQAQVAALFGSSFQVGSKRVKPATIAISGGAATVDANGDIRVTTSGCTAISLNDLFQVGKGYKFQVFSVFASASNVAFRTRLANVDNTTADYVFGGFFTTNSWPGTAGASAYGSVASSGLLGVNGGTLGYVELTMHPQLATQYPGCWHSEGFSRTGSTGTYATFSGDSSSSGTRTGITFFNGTFQVGTLIRVWEFE